MMMTGARYRTRLEPGTFFFSLLIFIIKIDEHLMSDVAGLWKMIT